MFSTIFLVAEMCFSVEFVIKHKRLFSQSVGQLVDTIFALNKSYHMLKWEFVVLKIYNVSCFSKMPLLHVKH